MSQTSTSTAATTSPISPAINTSPALTALLPSSLHRRTSPIPTTRRYASLTNGPTIPDTPLDQHRTTHEQPLQHSLLLKTHYVNAGDCHSPGLHRHSSDQMRCRSRARMTARESAALVKRSCVRRIKYNASSSWLRRKPLSPAYHVHRDACSQRLALQSWTNRMRRFYTMRLWEPQWRKGRQPIGVESRLKGGLSAGLRSH